VDVGLPLITAGVSVALWRPLVALGDTQMKLVAYLAAVSITTLLSAAAVTPATRAVMLQALRWRPARG
jgi:hypothetical protein